MRTILLALTGLLLTLTMPESLAGATPPATPAWKEQPAVVKAQFRPAHKRPAIFRKRPPGVFKPGLGQIPAHKLSVSRIAAHPVHRRRASANAAAGRDPAGTSARPGKTDAASPSRTHRRAGSRHKGHLPPVIAVPVPLPLPADEPAPVPPPPPAAASPAPLPAADWEDKPRRPREIVVLVSSATADGAREGLVRDYNLISGPPRPLTLLEASVLRLTIPDERPLAGVLAAVAADPRVISAQVNFVYELMESPGPDGGSLQKPDGQAQYSLAAMKVPQAHSLATGRGVLVAVIDTCVDKDHQDLGGSVEDSYDAISQGAQAPACKAGEKHGTSVAGIIAARRTLPGVAPDAKLLGVRAFARQSAEGKPEATTYSLATGMDWAFTRGARIMNLSFAGPDDPLLRQLTGRAQQRGAILVAAAGNAGPAAPPLYPAAYEGVIAVTAVDAAKRVYERANRGAYVALAAPGVDLLLLTPENGYTVDSGTSYAAAHVSGVAALMLERNPALPADQLRQSLAGSAEAAQGERDVYGAGLADAFGAVSAATPARAEARQ